MIKTTEFYTVQLVVRFFSQSKRTPFLPSFCLFQYEYQERQQKYFIAEEQKTNDGMLLSLSINETIRKEEVSDEWFFFRSDVHSAFSPKNGNESHKTPMQIFFM